MLFLLSEREKFQKDQEKCDARLFGGLFMFGYLGFLTTSKADMEVRFFYAEVITLNN